MRLLIDESLPRSVSLGLVDLDHDAVHVLELGLRGASDQLLLDLADEQTRVVVTADTDFGTLLALSGRASPSVVLLRRSGRSSQERIELIHRILTLVADELASGAIVSAEEARLRVRRLPIGSA